MGQFQIIRNFIFAEKKLETFIEGRFNLTQIRGKSARDGARQRTRLLIKLTDSVNSEKKLMPHDTEMVSTGPVLLDIRSSGSSELGILLSAQST